MSRVYPTYDELVLERDALKAENEAWAKAFSEHDNKTAALTAHVAELRGALEAAKEYMEARATEAVEPYPLMRCQSALSATPETSLAAHDAAVRREALT